MITRTEIDGLARHIAQAVGWGLGATTETQIERIVEILDLVTSAGVDMTMHGEMESAVPEMLVAQIDYVREELSKDKDEKIDIAEAMRVLDDAGDLASMLTDWIRELSQRGVRVPLTWTDYVHRRDVT